MTARDVRSEMGLGDLPQTKGEVIGMLTDTQRKLEDVQGRLKAAIRAQGEKG